ncbi:MAG: tryptophan--tRNA ligase [Deltaproteobacteria bacterium]|nr:tryptophan--tRNA ligase [Deltaproteobacteria bacterium]
MRATGRLHIGNYFGALANWLEFQKKYDCFFMVADYHAMTTGDLSQKTLAENTQQILLDWLSVGIDPAEATVFVQSAVPEHAELFVILSMMTSLGWLERNPTYKEQRQELGDKYTGNLGFLGYPVLQTADVCLYKATKVPVGEDQKPHLEMGRELARRFNSTFGVNVFPEFEAILTPTPKMLGLDRRKMSKSYGNVIELSENPDSIRKKIQKMVTDVRRPRKEDPGHPEDCNVFYWHQLLTPGERVKEIERDCKGAILSCWDNKNALADRVIAWLEPIQRKRRELEANLDYVNDVARKGIAKAREVAAKTMDEVRQVVGLWGKIDSPTAAH